VKETIFSEGRTSSKKYFAFFDLDRTIISANSGKLLMQYAYKKGLVTKKDLLKGIWLSVVFRLNLMDTLKIIDKMVSWLKGGSETAINELSQEIFRKEIIHSVRKEILTEISFHKREGAGGSSSCGLWYTTERSCYRFSVFNRRRYLTRHPIY